MEMSLHAMAAASVDTSSYLSPSWVTVKFSHSGGSYSSYRVWPDRPPHLDWNEDPSCWMGCVEGPGDSLEGQGISILGADFGQRGMKDVR